MTDPTPYELQRSQLVRALKRAGIRDFRVLDAVNAVPREEFVGEDFKSQAYLDQPLPIALDQTISQPYVVAWMLEHLRLSPADRVLEIGTGSGYAAALLSLLACRVTSVERHPRLASEARDRLHRLGYRVRVVTGDGTRGHPAEAPYNAILVSAGGPAVPAALEEQLAVGGRLVIPVGHFTEQELTLIERTPSGFQQADLGRVRFVPLLGEQGWKE